MPRVSVLMPTHNRADLIGFAIESVLAQTEPDFELLVVGDGCTDRTAEVVRSYDDRRIRWFDLPKVPHFGYANRNVALKQAGGELIAFNGDDDILFADHLELLLKAISRSDADWIYSRPLWVSSDGYVVPFCTNLGNEDELAAFLEQRNTIPANCVMHRASCFERAGYWPEDLERMGDWRLWQRIIEGGNRRSIDYLPVPTTLHFSATWKESRFSGIAEVKTIVEVAEESTWWPRALKYEVPDGDCEQSVIWQAMRNGGTQWIEWTRAGVATAIDRLAWDAVQKLFPAEHARSAEAGEPASDPVETEPEAAPARPPAHGHREPGRQGDPVRALHPLRRTLARFLGWAGSRKN